METRLLQTGSKWLLGLLVLGMMGCATTLMPTYEGRLSSGDEEVNWALAYFESWKRTHDPRFLFLTEEHTTEAIETFHRLQQDTAPSIREYFVVRERRVRGCRMFAELSLEAQAFGHHLSHLPPEYCNY